MPPDGGTAIQESQLLRTFGAPAAAAAFVVNFTFFTFFSSWADHILTNWHKRDMLNKIKILKEVHAKWMRKV